MGTKVKIKQVNNPYKCRAYLNTNMGSVANSTDVKVLLDAETYDTNNNFSDSKYTVPVTGWYQINAQIAMISIASTRYDCKVFKNGSALFRSLVNASFSNAVAPNVSDIAYLVAGDYIELYGNQQSGSTGSFIAGEQITFLSIHLIST